MAQKPSPEFCLKLTYRYLTTSLVTPGAGLFQLQGHNLYKLGRDPQGDATYQISRL